MHLGTADPTSNQEHNLKSAPDYSQICGALYARQNGNVADTEWLGDDRPNI